MFGSSSRASLSPCSRTLYRVLVSRALCLALWPWSFGWFAPPPFLNADFVTLLSFSGGWVAFPSGHPGAAAPVSCPRSSLSLLAAPRGPSLCMSWRFFQYLQPLTPWCRYALIVVSSLHFLSVFFHPTLPPPARPPLTSVLLFNHTSFFLLRIPPMALFPPPLTRCRLRSAPLPSFFSPFLSPPVSNSARRPRCGLAGRPLPCPWGFHLRPLLFLFLPTLFRLPSGVRPLGSTTSLPSAAGGTLRPLATSRVFPASGRGRLAPLTFSGLPLLAFRLLVSSPSSGLGRLSVFRSLCGAFLCLAPISAPSYCPPRGFNL